MNARKLLATGERPGAGLPLAPVEWNVLHHDLELLLFKLLTLWYFFNSNADKLIQQSPKCFVLQILRWKFVTHM